MSNSPAQKAQYSTEPHQNIYDPLTEKAMDAGWLGKAFGSPSNAPTNIAGLVATVLTFSLVVICFLSGANGELAKQIPAIITLVLGYLIGTNTGPKKYPRK